LFKATCLSIFGSSMALVTKHGIYSLPDASGNYAVVLGMMIYIKHSSRSQGYVRTLLLVWTLVLIAAAGIWWWLKSGRTPPAPVSYRAAYHLVVDPNRTDGVAIRLELQLPRGEDKPGLVVLTRPATCSEVVVRDPEGGIVPHREDGNRISFERRGDGLHRIHYRVSLGTRSGVVHTSIVTPTGGAARLKDLLLVPKEAVAMTLSVDLPVGWRLHGPAGLEADGSLGRSALASGAIAWTHSASQSLVSRPNSVEVFFLGKTGVGEPVLLPLQKMMQWLIKEVMVNRPLRHRLILVDMKVPHHRLVLPPQRDWQILERGPLTVHRLVRIARGVVDIHLSEESATPPGLDAPWYPGALRPYASYRAAEEAGGRSPLDWVDLRQILVRDYLWERNQKTGRRASALKGAAMLWDLSRVIGNARSIRLLSEPARNKTRKASLTIALAMQMNMTDPRLFERARDTGVYLEEGSRWKLPALVQDPVKPAGAAGPVNLRLLVTGETYAEVMGCTGCPAPGTIAQRVFRQQVRSNEGIPTLVVDSGDWAPFFLSEDPDLHAFRDRIEIVRMAAARAGAAALVIGPGEMGWGRDSLETLISGKSEVPLISANLQLENGPSPRTHVVRTLGDMTVAVIGITDFPRRRYRLSWFEEALQGVKVEDPVDAVSRVAKEVRTVGVDLVLVVGAIDPVHARLIAVGDPNVDLVVSSSPGFDRPPAAGETAFTARDRSGFHGRTPVLYTAGHRGNLHRFDVRIGRVNGRCQVLDFIDAPERLKDGDPGEPEIQKKEVDFQNRHARPHGTGK